MTIQQMIFYSYYESDELSEAIIPCEKGVVLSQSSLDALRYGQRVIEAQFLGEPCLILAADLPRAVSISKLYDNIGIVYKDDWSTTIDSAPYFLMNKRMYELCMDNDSALPRLRIFESDHLEALFDKEFFVVANIGANK